MSESNSGDHLITPHHLGGKDVSLLRAVRAINRTHQLSEGSDVGAPATTGRIREVANLSSEEVNHRLKRSNTLDDLLHVHGASVRPDGSMGPKSAELTDEGQQVLDDLVNETLDASDLATSDDIQDLRDELTDLRARLKQIEESPTGAFSQEEAERLDSLKRMMVAFQDVFEQKLDIDLDPYRRD